MKRKSIIASSAFLCAGLVGAATAPVVSAAPSGDHKVTICHATSSATNPYTTPTVSWNSIDNVRNVDLNGHGDHERDIIPPFADFAGKNWTVDNAAIWANDCKVPNGDGPT